MAFEAIKERIRRGLTGDDKYTKSLPYFFELIVPGEVGGVFGTNYLFPLVLNPEEISMTENFSVAETPTQGGGLFVEEGGIISRQLSIRGTTGFKPRPFKGSNFVGIQTAERRSYNRMNASSAPIAAISGQRHFQFLQDAVFRTYADLKRDPSTAEETRLLFHNPKDDEHWLVVPQSFRLERSSHARTRVAYDYAIELLVVDAAEANNRDFSEDKSLFEQLKDGLRAAKNFVDGINGMIRDVTAMVDELRRFVKDIGKVLNGFAEFVNTVSDFVGGVDALIRAPKQTLVNLLDNLEAATERLADSVNGIPDTIVNSFRKGADSSYALAAHPEVFVTAIQATLQSVTRAAELTTSRTQTQLAAAQGTTVPSLRAAAKLGTANLPGDLDRSRAEQGLGRAQPQYQSAKEYELTSTDTLQSLAAGYLGDARLWRHIAVLNNLKYPFISDVGLPGTLGRGDKILIPSFAKAPEARALQAVLGAERESALRERLLGVDFRFEEQNISGKLFDFQIDTDHGSIDRKLVRGVDCLKQGCLLRLRTEQGTAILYKRFGMLRIVGTGAGAIDDEILRFRIGQTIAADPRIAAVRQVNLVATEGQSADVLEPEIWAEVRGLAGTEVFRLSAA